MRLKDIKERVYNDLAEKIKEREECRGSGVYLGENIGSYYIQVGEIFALQKLCEYLGIKTDLVYYDPFETEEDDEKFNYWSGIGPIGKKED